VGGGTKGPILSAAGGETLKVKQRPEDFRVEEENRLEPGAGGDFALYRLEKSGIGTPEALQVVARAWRLGPRATAFAGLKDRYGVTGQLVSVHRGPSRNFEGRGFKLNFLGRAARPVGRGTIQRNRFRLVLRDLRPSEADRLASRARDAAVHGVPDYYDDQRFGSLRGTNGRFVAEALLRGDHAAALRLATASPARQDRSRLKRRRKMLQQRWGRWEELARGLEPSLEQRICAHLAAGGTFAEAYGMLARPLRSLHLAAFQAHLFNECLRRAVPARGPRHSGAAGPYVFFEGDPGDLKERRIPLVSDEAPPDPLLDGVMTGAGLARGGLPFRPGTRGAVVVPDDLKTEDPEDDDLNRGKVKVALSFALRPGSYATMIVKRCTYDM